MSDRAFALRFISGKYQGGEYPLAEAGDAEGSLAEYRSAVQHAPAYVPARVALGTALYAGGKLDEAVQQWEEVLRMDPSHRTASMYLKLAKGRPG